MQIEKKYDGHVNKMVIKGLIKSVEDSAYFKEVMLEMLGTPSKALSIYIEDSFIVTSSIIGYILKAINIDKADITLYVHEDDLYKLLSQLNLLEQLHVKKV